MRCADAGFECDAVVAGETGEEILAQVCAHARTVHGVEVTPQVAGRLRGRITDA